MDRLSTLDSAFLRLETPDAHMHVGFVALVGLPGDQERLHTGALRRQIASRLSMILRFRQRVVDAPLGFGEPSWEDDPSFRLDDHLRVIDAAAPVGTSQLSELADAFLSQQLPRTRPLWELLVVPRVAGRRAAIIGKVHHAMVDGVAAVELGALLFDLDPAGTPIPAVEWRPRPQPSPVRRLAASVGDEAIEQLRLARGAIRMGLEPRRTARVADSMRRAAFGLAEDLVFAAPRSSLNAPIGSQRALRAVRLDMDRAQRMKRSAGATLNDVALALVSGALRRYSAGAAEPPARLRAMVPVSVRDDARDDPASGRRDPPPSRRLRKRHGEQPSPAIDPPLRGVCPPATAPLDRLGNRIAFGMVDLPVDEPAPLRRLGRVRGEMLALKSSGRIGASDLIMRSLGPLPGPVKDRAARLVASPRLYNLVVSNTPGPRTPLYAAGARVLEISPVIPLSEDHALAVGILSYGDGLQFAFHADPVALPAVDLLPRHLLAAAAELERALGLRPARHAAASRRRAAPRSLARQHSNP